MIWLALTVLAADPVTEKNWEHHPAIEAVRTAVAEVESALKAKQLTAKNRDCGDETATIWTDAKGDVRLLSFASRGHDGVDTLDFYYDAHGTLRFLHEADGFEGWHDHEESRVWFDEAGKAVWRRHRGDDTDHDLTRDERALAQARDPRTAYASKKDDDKACKETPGPARSLKP